MQVAKQSRSGIPMESGSLIMGRGSALKLKEKSNTPSPYDIVQQLASCNAVVVFSMTGCCMSTVAKRLLFSLGVGPTIIELDQHSAGQDIQAVLYQLSSATDRHQSVPAVFVGGKFLGGIQNLMAAHINGTLVPLLKDAGALWL